MSVIEPISDDELADICERNDHPYARALLLAGESQRRATDYIDLSMRPRYEDDEGRWLYAYIEWLRERPS